MKITPLFSSPLIETSLDIDIPKGKSYNFLATTGSSLISKELRILKNYPEVEKAILDEFKNVVDEFLHYPNEIIITTSWLTRAEKGHTSSLHSHKNSFWSGVYYFDDYPEDSGGIEFHSPLLPFADFQVQSSSWNIYNSSSWEVKPFRGKLIFFPSYVMHQIKMHNITTPRHSLAFNMVPIGEYGGDDSTYNTDWT